ncbi:MAG: PAS domain S-box protein [Candidatus Riflebacteria bacterium]|nr:PAS domain S-box protein [Candidatus Riflebacteria bacterium]
MEFDEKTVQKSEKRLMDWLGEGIFNITESFIVSYVNISMAAMLGYNPDEMIGRSFFDFVDADGKKIALEKLKNRKKGVAEEFNFQFLNKNGDLIYTKVNSTPTFDESGTFIGEMALVYDFTEQVTLKKELRDVQNQVEFLGNLFQNFTQPFTTVFSDGSLGIFNQAFCHLLGYTKKELETIKFTQILTPPEWHSLEEEKLLELRTTGKTVRYEKEYIRKNGTRVPIEVFTHLSNDEAGQLKFYYAFVNDITELKLHQISKEALKQERLFLRQLLDSIPNHVFVKTLDGTFLLVNQAAAKFFGMAPETIIGKKIEDFKFAISKDTFEAFQKNLTKVIQDKSPQFLSSANLVGADNKDTWLAVAEVPLTNKSGNIDKTLVVGTDITHQKVIEEDLKKAKKMAETANQAKNSFLSNMSHELRTPLNGILGLVRILRSSEFCDKEKEYLEGIEKSGMALLSIIDDILNISEIESGKINFVESEFSIRTFLQNLIKGHENSFSSDHLKIFIKVENDVPDVLRTDRVRFFQIINNLLSNAIKFTAKGKVTIEVNLKEVHERRVLLQIDVSDTGRGMKPEALEKLFLPFEPGDSSYAKNFAGIGLGLAICKGLVKLMSGKIWAESQEGVGSTFHLLLSFKSQATIHIPPKVQPKVGYKNLWVGDKLHVLVAEDDVWNQRILAALLKNMGHSVEIAANGEEAIEKSKTIEFEIILMDIMMPILDGVEAMRRIRAWELERNIHTPIIALTAYVLHDDEKNFLSAGFDGYIAKPMNNEKLVSEMKRCTARFPKRNLTIQEEK